MFLGFLGGSDCKESMRETCVWSLGPWVRRIPWRREWLPTPVFLPGEFHGQRSLVGYGLWGHKESDTTERLTYGCFQASLVTQMVKNLLAMRETWVWYLDWGDPLENSIATHSSILACRILMDRGDWWAAVHRSQRFGHDWATKHTHMHVSWGRWLISVKANFSLSVLKVNFFFKKMVFAD